ncbi:MAG: hypothetical protein HY903_22605 [Deltaproteobacteria bacterium]|nr:hypothetical protein [Deltaproteobacteria bacterium]
MNKLTAATCLATALSIAVTTNTVGAQEAAPGPDRRTLLEQLKSDWPYRTLADQIDAKYLKLPWAFYKELKVQRFTGTLEVRRTIHASSEATLLGRTGTPGSDSHPFHGDDGLFGFPGLAVGVMTTPADFGSRNPMQQVGPQPFVGLTIGFSF